MTTNPIHAVTDEILPDVQPAVKLGRELGIAAYVLRMSQNQRFPDWKPEDMQFLFDGVAQGLKVDVISCGFFKDPYPGGDIHELVRPAIAALSFAPKVGARKFVCFGWAKPVGWQPKPDAVLAPEFPGDIITGFQLLADEARKLDLQVLIEVGYQTWGDTGYGVLEMIRRIDRPNIRAVYDPSNSVSGRVRRGTAHGKPLTREIMPVLLDEISKLGALIAEVHVRDLVWDDQDYHYVPVGEGLLDWPAMLDALHGVGYKGPLTIEHHLPNKAEMARHTHDYLAQLMKSDAARGNEALLDQ